MGYFIGGLIVLGLLILLGRLFVSADPRTLVRLTRYLVGFGLVGYVFKKLEYPLAPLVLAMVLGDKAEDAFRQSMLLSDGKLSIFWSNGLVTTLMLVGFALLVSPLVFWLLGISRRRKLGMAASGPQDRPAA